MEKEQLKRVDRINYKFVGTLDKKARRLQIIYILYCIIGYVGLGMMTINTHQKNDFIIPLATLIFGSASKDILSYTIYRINNYPEKLNSKYRRLEKKLNAAAALMQTVIIIMYFEKTSNSLLFSTILVLVSLYLYMYRFNKN
ncbi:hypothetical protein [Staphylococcus epidermidis]|uniref:hypothetical protein n=1 Tax=Staphylococcus epidermidis TaxID=1282 RepID=UPI0020963775|nr:hypothetical protein [Staphylococcus epidermidis]MCO6321390.1 hypothetical protein [Staphylococcus epidermidis]